MADSERVMGRTREKRTRMGLRRVLTRTKLAKRFVELPCGVAAMRSGQIDAMSNLDPVITLLQRSGDLKIVADTRIVAESERIFGGPMPGGCLYAPQPFIDKNPNTVQALSRIHI